MEDEKLLNQHVEIARALAELLSPLLECSVCDLRKSTNRYLAVFNGHISGISLADTIDPEVLAQLHSQEATKSLLDLDKSKSAGQTLKTRILKIHNEQAVLIGALCFRFDISFFHKMSSFLSAVLQDEQNSSSSRVEQATLQTPQQEIQGAIEKFLLGNNWQFRQLSTADKKELVGHLHQTGYFNKRGAVTIIAAQLALTRPTVYSYLNEMRGERASAAVEVFDD